MVSESSRTLMQGDEACAESAIAAGCRFFAGYPITPATEIAEMLARRLPQVGGVFIQMEDEIASLSAVIGASVGGAKAMTATSSPGFSLMQEGISYIACSMVPAVVVNVMRGGPGLGNIQPAQADYSQMTKGGGHGDYKVLTLAPSTIQELVDHVGLAFDLADKYRQIVFVIADGMLGQMMEPVELPEMRELRPPPAWALTGAKGRPKNIITSLYLNAPELEKVNQQLQAVYQRIEADEVRYETYLLEDADIAVVAYGTAARIARTAIRKAREAGIRVGLFRPITVYPFPYEALKEATGKVQEILVVEMSAGQMLEDARIATCCQVPIRFFGKMGGIVPLPEDILAEIEAVAQGKPALVARKGA